MEFGTLKTTRQRVERHRNRGRRRGRAEGKRHRGTHAREELEGIEPKDPQEHGVDDQQMKQQRAGEEQEITRQRYEDIQPLRRKRPGQQRKQTDRRQLDDQQHHLQDHFVQFVEQLHNGLRPFARQVRRKSEQQCEDDDLEHLPFRHRLNGVFREDVDKDFSQARHFPGGDFGEGPLQFEAFSWRHDQAQRQAQGDGRRRGRKKEAQGLAAYSPDRSQVAHGVDPANQRDQHQWNHHELQQREEYGADDIEKTVHQKRIQRR